MSKPKYAITGIPVPPGAAIPVRRNVDDLQKDSLTDETAMMQFSLFVRAMAAFQAMDIKDMKSYYQIAGIHSYPGLPWDEDRGGYYCHHNDILFATWHRPYMALVEQRLHEIMVDIINGFNIVSGRKSKDDWRAVADKWRLPYWDWTNATSPVICTTATIDIMDENEKMVTVNNPFWKFTNPVLDSAGKPVAMGNSSMGKYKLNNVGPFPFSECKATSRHGIVTGSSDDWQDGIVNVAGVDTALQHPDDDPSWPAGTNIAQVVERLLSRGTRTTYTSFVTTRYYSDTDPTAYLNLEYIHNNVHGWTGGFSLTDGAGHMSIVPVAAFDPIFYLHHCFIDRLLASWQALNWDNWFDGRPSGAAGPTVTLRPFHSDTKGTVYNSDMVRYWTQLNYAYEGITPPSSGVSTAEIRAMDVAPQPSHAAGLPGLARNINKNFGFTRKKMLESTDVEGHKNDYIINVIYDRYALGGASYAIHFFLGPADDGPNLMRNPNHIGVVYTFSGGQELTGVCPNCQQQKEERAFSTAQVPLTIALLRHVRDEGKDLWSLTPSGVSDYLAKNLNWKYVMTPGVIIGHDRIPDTKIGVFQGRAEHSTDDDVLSRYHSYQPIYEPTANKPGGLRSGENLNP